ncbi:MAG: CBS domain-containing protein [Planctomycetes bacterium]|nr:CBS domain-containing protein [Planctomycetota bacterium]
MKALNVAQSPAPQIPSDMTVQDAIQHLETRCGCAVAVVQAHKLVGVLSKDDVLRKCVAAGKDPAKTKVSEVMDDTPITATIDTSTEEAMQLMLGKGQCYLPIVNHSGQVAAWLAVCQLFEDHVDHLTREVCSLSALLGNDAPGG